MPKRIEPIGCIEDITSYEFERRAQLFDRLKDIPTVYLIHFEEPLKHARHYIGSTMHLTERMRCYCAGNADSSRIMAAVHRECIAWRVVRIWTFDTPRQMRDWEYQFKKGADGKQHIKPASRCPVCLKDYRDRAAERMRQKRSRS